MPISRIFILRWSHSFDVHEYDSRRYGVGCSILFLVLGAGLGLPLLGRAMSQHCSNACAAAQGDEGCFDFKQWFGLMLQIYMIPLGVLAVGVCIVEFSQRVCVSALS